MALKMFSQSFIDKLVCPKSKTSVQYRDSGTSGLIVEVWRSGIKSYILSYRAPIVKMPRYRKIGDATTMKLDEVKILVEQYQKMLSQGKDPFKNGKNKQNKQENKIQRNARGRDHLAPTLAHFAANAYLPYAKSYKRSWKSDEGLLNNHILPIFGQYRMNDIQKHEIITFIGKHRETHAPASVNRVVILMRFMFNCAIKWQVPNVTINVTHGIPMLEENNCKERFLTHTEVNRILRQVKFDPNEMMQYIIPMLILTGARKREVLDAKWEDFDFDKRIWRIPMTKSGKPRFVPMSHGVIDLLNTLMIEQKELIKTENLQRAKRLAKALRKWENRDDVKQRLAELDRPSLLENSRLARYETLDIDGVVHVFANPKTGKPFNTIHNAWDRIRHAVDLKDVRIHDLRHSFASFLVNNGRSLYEVQRILGHSQIKTTQRYAHLSQGTLLEAADIVADFVSHGINAQPKTPKKRGTVRKK